MDASLAHHPLSLSSSSSSTSSSGASAMAEVSFVLKLLRRARVCRGGQRWLTWRNKTPTSLLKWRVTCCSLLDPFCFCFRRPSYCFRPSRYSTTASLDGCFSGGESLYVIHVNEGGKDVWGWGEIGVLKRLGDLTPRGQRWTDRLQSASEDSDSHLPWWES